MTILIIGGTGNTGLRLARLLRAANIPVLLTSRSGTAPESFPAAKFDWDDATTFSAPFEKDPSIDKVYLIAPVGVHDMLSVAKPFIDEGIERGMKKWVLLSASQCEKGGALMGAIHQYLHDKDVDYTALRPTWFIENFSIVFEDSIRKRNEITTAAGDGRIPQPSKLSPRTKYKGADPFIVGPELFTYDEAAALLSTVLGRKITHKRLTAEEVAKGFMSIGLSEHYATSLAAGEEQLASGVEEKVFLTEGDKTVKYVGRTSLREYFERNKDIWAVSASG